MMANGKAAVIFLLSILISCGACADIEEKLLADIGIAWRSVDVLNSGKQIPEDLNNERIYRRLVRPVGNGTDVITVKFGLAICQIISVNEQDQVVKTNVWLRHSWYDPSMAWNSSEYGNIKVIRVPPEYVWLPDIVLLNNADGVYEVSERVRVLIYSDGMVEWIPPVIYQTSCKINVQYFPFDQQLCKMKFGSWTFNGEQLRLGFYYNLPYVTISDYVKSSTWDFIDGPGYVYIDETTSPSRTEIVFELHIQRKTLFFTVNLVIPCLLMSMLSVLVFYLPPDSQEKVTLSISLLVAIVVFLLVVFNLLPPTSDTIPLLAKYLMFTFLTNVITMAISVIVINWNFRSPTTHRTRKVLQTIFVEWLPRYLCIRRPSLDHDDVESTQNANGTKSKANYMDVDNLHHPKCDKLHKNHNFGDDSYSTYSYLNEFAAEMRNVADAVEVITENMRTTDAILEIEDDWTYISMVVDRLLLYIFCIVTVVGTLYIICTAPGIRDFVDQDQRLKELGKLVDDVLSGLSDEELAPYFIYNSSKMYA